jgi:hypothetical protein
LVEGVETVAFFLDHNGGLADPATFSDGTAVTEFAAHFHNLLSISRSAKASSRSRTS